MADQPARDESKSTGAPPIVNTSPSAPSPPAVSTSTTTAPTNLSFVVVGAVAAVSALWTIVQIASLISRPRSAAGYVQDSVSAVIGLGVLASAWLAWQVGGYRALLSSDKRELAGVIHRKLIGFVHEFAENVVRASAYAAAVTVFMSVSDATILVRQISAGITVGLFVGGLLIRFWTQSNRTALSARATNLRDTLNQLGKSTEHVRQRMANAAFELEDIEQQIGSQLRHLSEDQESIDKLSDFLKGDKKAVASMERQRRKEGRRALTHTWLAFVAGAILTLILTVYPPTPILDWLKAHVHL